MKKTNRSVTVKTKATQASKSRVSTKGIIKMVSPYMGKSHAVTVIFNPYGTAKATGKTVERRVVLKRTKKGYYTGSTTFSAKATGHFGVVAKAGPTTLKRTVKVPKPSTARATLGKNVKTTASKSFTRTLKISPAYGRKVVLQKYSGSKWVNTNTYRTKNVKKAQVRVKLKAPKSGTVKYRVNVPATTQTKSRTGAVLHVSAKPKTAAPGSLALLPTGDMIPYTDIVKKMNALKVKGKAPQTGYNRSLFKHWTKANGSNCDTRNFALARDLIDKKMDKKDKCKVLSGTLLYEPYTGQRDRKFKAGGTYAQALDGEHVVALGNAWISGAHKWDAGKRELFANDPLNVMMVDPSQNRSKGARNAAEWLPPNKPYRCDFISVQVVVKSNYNLAVTKPEKTAMSTVLDGCAK